MKSTGVVRRIDDLGRIVIPKEIRKVNGIAEGDPMEIFTDGDKIILRKYEPACIFCGETENVINFHGKNVCADCVDSLGVIKSA